MGGRDVQQLGRDFVTARQKLRARVNNLLLDYGVEPRIVLYQLLISESESRSKSDQHLVNDPDRTLDPDPDSRTLTTQNQGLASRTSWAMFLFVVQLIYRLTWDKNSCTVQQPKKLARTCYICQALLRTDTSTIPI